MVLYEIKCNCLQTLLDDGIVSTYCAPYNALASSVDFSEEGTLCLVNNYVEDKGYYTADGWYSDINIRRELYPIEYCPICGKKIEYKKIPSLTKKI